MGESRSLNCSLLAQSLLDTLYALRLDLLELTLVDELSDEDYESLETTIANTYGDIWQVQRSTNTGMLTAAPCLN